MSKDDADLVRRAHQADAGGDLAGRLELVDPDLEWTYLDPASSTPPRGSAAALRAELKWRESRRIDVTPGVNVH
jgi:ketosteroid isomerase-like protein